MMTYVGPLISIKARLIVMTALLETTGAGKETEMQEHRKK